MKLKLLFLFIILIFLGNSSFSQARIVFGTSSDAYLVMGNTFPSVGEGATTSIYLVIGDSVSSTGVPTNTITRTTNGGIVSNSELNIVKWYIGANQGAYTIPWYHSAGNYIPFTANKGNTSVNQNGKYINFATYRTTTATNSSYAPSGVTNFYSPSCACDPSLWMIDRFWMIDNNNYDSGSLPQCSLTFTYLDGGSNTQECFTGSGAGSQNANITAALESNLEAEGYNGPANKWAGVTYGSNNAATNTLGPTANIPLTKLYKWWVIVDKAKPLPVEFADASAECVQGNMTIKWSTASEQNSDYFTVEKSTDGTNFTIATTVKAAGNSSTTKNYSVVDHDAFSGTSFYRIKETDFDGQFSYSGTITVSGCNSDNVIIYGTEGGASININALTDGQYSIEMYDLLGKKIVSDVKNVSAGSNHIKFVLDNVASAIYIVKVYNDKNTFTKKVFIRSNIN